MSGNSIALFFHLQIGKIVIPVTAEDIEEGERRTQNQVNIINIILHYC